MKITIKSETKVFKSTRQVAKWFGKKYVEYQIMLIDNMVTNPGFSTKTLKKDGKIEATYTLYCLA